MLPQGGYSLIGPVGLVPLDVVESLPSIQLESGSVFLPVQRVVVLHTLAVSGVQMVLPVLKGGVRLAHIRFTKRASVPSSPYPIMLAPLVLFQVSSLDPFSALWARYLLLLVRPLSGHPAALGWPAVRSTRSNELTPMSSSPCYIVPVHPPAAPPVPFRPADFRASPFRLADWPSPWRFLMLPPPSGLMGWSNASAAAPAGRALLPGARLLLILALSLARSARFGDCHYPLAPRVLPPRVPRLPGGWFSRPSRREQPHVS